MREGVMGASEFGQWPHKIGSASRANFSRSYWERARKKENGEKDAGFLMAPSMLLVTIIKHSGEGINNMLMFAIAQINARARI